MPTRPSIAEVRMQLSLVSGRALRSLVRELEDDDRLGVRREVEKALRQDGRRATEVKRLQALYELEERLREQGAQWIAGLDEVGRGAVAGPVTVAACILPATPMVEGLDDSKRLLPEKREAVARDVRSKALAWSIAHVAPAYVDAAGMSAALRKAATIALSALPVRVDRLLVDGLGMGVHPQEVAVVKGDAKVAAIAAASVLAKVSRDAVMAAMDERYPEYRLGENKGYGSLSHLEVVERIGASAVHRRTFLKGALTDTLF